MNESLAEGLSVTRKFTVDKGRTIDFMGEDLRIYATPELLRDVEQTCRDMLFEHCDDGEDSVGTHVSLTHSAATPMGMDVEITATVAKVDGRLVTIEFTAHDGLEECGKGKHTRFVVDMAKTGERLAAKVAKANA